MARRVLLCLCGRTDIRCEQSQSLSSDLQDYLEHQDMKIQDLKRDVAQAQTHVTRLTRQAEFKDEQLQRCTQQLHSLNSKVRRRPAAVTSWPPPTVTSSLAYISARLRRACISTTVCLQRFNVRVIACRCVNKLTALRGYSSN